MPRRGRSGGFSMPARRPAPTLPAQRPPTAPVAAQPKQPGLMANMAATAGGVAVGSMIGHTLGAAITGHGGGGGEMEQQQPQQQYYQEQQQQPQFACQLELKQFLDCAQSQSDVGLCYGFNEALKQCKMLNGMQ